MSQASGGLLTDQGKGGGALRRAAVELLVIVAGVLIALSADQWWSALADARTETAYLSGMVDDIEATLLGLRAERESALTYLTASAELSKLRQVPAGISEDSLTVLVSNSLFNIVSWASRLSTLDDLKNTGRLGLISDADIRIAFADIDRLASGIAAAEDDLIQTQHQTVDPFLVRRADLPALVPASLVQAVPYLGPALGRAPSALLSDPEFHNIVALRVVLLQNLQGAYIRMHDHLVEVSALIETRLQ